MIYVDVKADLKQLEIKKMVAASYNLYKKYLQNFEKKKQNRRVFYIKFWLFYSAWHCRLRASWSKFFAQQTKSVKHDKSYLLMTLPKQIILPTNRLSNSSSAYIARYSLNILYISGMSNACKLHKHYQNIIFYSMFNIFF